MNQSLGEFFGSLLSLFFIISSLVTFSILIWGAAGWVSPKGDTQKSRDRITYALVGLTTITAIFTLVQLSEVFFDIKLISSTENVPPAIFVFLLLMLVPAGLIIYNYRKERSKEISDRIKTQRPLLFKDIDNIIFKSLGGKKNG